MKLDVRSAGPGEHILTVEVPAEEVEGRLDAVARQLQRRASLPGFRKGKVPLDMVRQQYAEHVEREFIESYLPEAAGQAVSEAGLEPAIPPSVRNLNFAPGAPLTFEAVVNVKPKAELTHYKGVRLTRRVRAIDEARVDAVLEDLREQSAVFVDRDRPAERGDVVLIDSTRLDANGRRLPSTRIKGGRLELGAAGMLPDLENGLLGASAGQERTIEVSYPAEHEAKDLAGRTVRYVVNVRKIQEKKLRPLDDTFATEVFQLASMDELRTRVRSNLEREEQLRTRREMEAAVSDELVRRNPVELPERLVRWMLDRVVHEATEGRPVPDALRQELETRYRTNVERSLQREAILEAIANQEGLEVSDDEVTSEIQRMAQADPRQASRIRARYQTAERRQALRETIREHKALDWVLQAADVQEEVVSESPLVVPATR